MPQLLPLLLLTLSAASTVAGRRTGGCAGVGFKMKATDGVCNRRHSIVFSAFRPLVTFDDYLPSAACNLSILVPPGGNRLFTRLRYLAVRLFQPTPVELDDLRKRRGLCLEISFSVRPLYVPSQQLTTPTTSSAFTTTGASSAAATTSATPTPVGPALRQSRRCINTGVPGAAWVFEELPPWENSTLPGGGGGGFLAEFAWRLVRTPGIAPAATGGASDIGPVRLTFTVAPFFDCSSDANKGRYVHCMGAGRSGQNLCVPKSLACCSPVVNYLECPGRAMFISSIMECALFNPDVGFYLFLVVAGTSAVSVVMLCLLLQPVVTLVKRNKVEKAEKEALKG